MFKFIMRQEKANLTCVLVNFNFLRIIKHRTSWQNEIVKFKGLFTRGPTEVIIATTKKKKIRCSF